MFNNKVENKALEMDFINFNLQIFLSKKIARQTPKHTPLLGEEQLLPQSNHYSLSSLNYSQDTCTMIFLFKKQFIERTYISFITLLHRSTKVKEFCDCLKLPYDKKAVLPWQPRQQQLERGSNN